MPWWEKVSAGKFENGKFSLKQLTGGKLDDITVVVARVTDAVPVVVEVPEAAEESETAAAESAEAPAEQPAADAEKTGEQ